MCGSTAGKNRLHAAITTILTNTTNPTTNPIVSRNFQLLKKALLTDNPVTSPPNTPVTTNKKFQ